MIYHSNLPPFQGETQQLADRFNRDEHFWHSLKGRRRLRRKLVPWPTEQEQKLLDQLEFSRSRPPEDCIGKTL
jgi:hypothetical protein